MGPGGIFATDPDLADILGDMNFDVGIFYFLWSCCGMAQDVTLYGGTIPQDVE